MKLNPDYLSLFSSLPTKADKKQISVYPDAIPYDLDENEFKAAVKQLLPADGASYFYYVKYHDIRLVSRPRFVWEKIRGFWGASNHSKSKLVTLTLLKLAYYGQCKGYDITSLLSTPYLNQFDKTKLKTELINFYRKHHFSLQRINIHSNIRMNPMNPDFCFGDTLMWLSKKTHTQQTIRNIAKIAMQLNPSDPLFAKKHVSTWIKEFRGNEDELDNATDQNAMYRECIAKAYLSNLSYTPSLKNIIYWKKEVELAIQFDKNIYKHFPKEVFFYCIETGQFQQAVQLLPYLTPAAQSDETINAIMHLTDSNKKAEFINLLKSNYNTIAISIAPYFMNSAKNYLKPEKIPTSLYTMMSSGLNKVGTVFGSYLGISATQNKLIPPQTGWNDWFKYASISAMLDNAIETSYALYFAEYYCMQNNPTEAFRFIQKHPSIDEQFNYIQQSKFSDAFKKCVSKDSELAIKLSSLYLEKSKKDANAANTLQQLSSWQIDPPLFFSNYVRDKQYDEAYRIFLQLENTRLLKADCVKELALHYFNDAIHAIHPTLSKAQKFEILQNKIESFEKAYLLAPENDDIRESFFNYKRELISLSLDFSEKERKNDIGGYIAAINQYYTLFDLKAFLVDDCLVKDLISAYDKTIALLLLDVQDKTSTCNGVYANNDYKNRTKISREQLKALLEQAISHLQTLNDVQYNPFLAKLHFILGDLKVFFGETGGMDHLNEAVKLANNNPFYQTFTADISDQLESHQLVDFIIQVFDTSPLHIKSYHDWKDERWHAKKIKSNALPSIYDVTFDSSVLDNTISNQIRSALGLRR